jgi:hypothetical protein
MEPSRGSVGKPAAWILGRFPTAETFAREAEGAGCSFARLPADLNLLLEAITERDTLPGRMEQNRHKKTPQLQSWSIAAGALSGSAGP